MGSRGSGRGGGPPEERFHGNRTAGGCADHQTPSKKTQEMVRLRRVAVDILGGLDRLIYTTRMIDRYICEGRVDYYERMIDGVPEQLSQVSKRVALLHNQIGITIARINEQSSQSRDSAASMVLSPAMQCIHHTCPRLHQKPAHASQVTTRGLLPSQFARPQFHQKPVHASQVTTRWLLPSQFAPSPSESAAYEQHQDSAMLSLTLACGDQGDQTRKCDNQSTST